MSEQQDKQRAIEALERAGYRFDPLKTEVALVACDVYRHTDNLPGYSPNTAVVYADESVVCMEVYVPAGHVPALLNPMTKERVETVVRSVLDGYVTRTGDYEIGRIYGGLSAQTLGDTIMAQLFPEEAPTDANPG